MQANNKIILITYADSLGCNLNELESIVDEHFKNAIGGIHILPFYPSSADRGFAPITYEEVDPKFGKWDDLISLSTKYYLMYDFMINHISRSSEYFIDYIQKGQKSRYADLFIKYSEFWPNGSPTKNQADLIYKRKPRLPYIDVEFKDGKEEKIWCTFDEEQIDLNVSKTDTLNFIKKSLVHLSKMGASIIRLDAFAYAIKKLGTNCFFIEPEVWDLLQYCNNIVEDRNVMILPEIHEHYSIQKKISEKGYYVYDFALPMLMLHALYTCRVDRLIHWFNICPRNQFTTLDTHDGIGIVDVKDLLTDEEINETKEQLYSKGANVKKIYSSATYNNLDIYQVNCTYYSALGDNDQAYLLARAIQFFAPGIPQVYYVGLLAGANDIDLLEKTKNGRDINRHYYTISEINKELKRPVVKALIQLMEFRNQYPAFNGEIEICAINNRNTLNIEWTKDQHKATLKAELLLHEFCIKYVNEEGEIEVLNIF